MSTLGESACTSGCTKENYFTSTYPAESDIAAYFELAKEITNGTKHFRPKAKTRVQAGFSSGFSERPFHSEVQNASAPDDDLPTTMQKINNRAQVVTRLSEILLTAPFRQLVWQSYNR